MIISLYAQVYREYLIPMKLVMCQYDVYFGYFHPVNQDESSEKTDSSPKIYRREKGRKTKRIVSIS